MELVYLPVQLVLTPRILDLASLLQLRSPRLRLLNDSFSILPLQLLPRGPLVSPFLQLLLSLLLVQHFFASLVKDLLLGDRGPGPRSVHHSHLFVPLVVEGAADERALGMPEIVQKVLQECVMRDS